MNKFFAANISGRGRLVRAACGVALLVGAVLVFSSSHWFGLLLAAAGLFSLVEAARGWCVLRACGVKTRL